MAADLSHDCRESVKVAIVIADLGGGGTQRVVSRLANKWSQLGHEVTLITLSDTQDDYYEIPSSVRRKALGVVGYSRNKIMGLIANFRRLYLLRKAVSRSGAKVVVSFITTTNIQSLLACAFLGKRVLISERNDPALQPLGGIWQCLRRLLYPRADMVVTNNINSLTTLSCYVPEERLSYIPNNNKIIEDAVDIDPSLRSKEILAVGRLHPQKALHLAILGFKKSGIADSGWTLVIVGEGAERPKLQALIDQHELSGSVRLCGYDDNIGRRYANAGAMLMTSLYEGTPNTVIEALAHGLPVLVSQSAGDGPRLVELADGGICFEPGREAAVADALLSFANDHTAYQVRAAAARDRIRSYFAECRIISLWETVLRGGRADGRKEP